LPPLLLPASAALDARPSCRLPQGPGLSPLRRRLRRGVGLPRPVAPAPLAGWLHWSLSSCRSSRSTACSLVSLFTAPLPLSSISGLVSGILSHSQRSDWERSPQPRAFNIPQGLAGQSCAPACLPWAQFGHTPRDQGARERAPLSGSCTRPRSRAGNRLRYSGSSVGPGTPETTTLAAPRFGHHRNYFTACTATITW
jgi:hypothetical protein